MATWQFDFHFLPREAVERHFGTVPLTIRKTDFDCVQWWKDSPPPANLSAELSKLLPKISSWSRDIEMWGEEEGDRIDVVGDRGKLSDLFVRVDVRKISSVFLIAILELARHHDWLLFTQDGRVLAPSMKKILSAIQRSDCFKFVENPAAFLSEMSKNQDSDR